MPAPSKRPVRKRVRKPSNNGVQTSARRNPLTSSKPKATRRAPSKKAVEPLRYQALDMAVKAYGKVTSGKDAELATKNAQTFLDWLNED